MKKSFFKNIKIKAIKIMGLLGPGFVTGSADDDPSGIGTYSIAGARYGVGLAWLVPFLLPLMYIIQEMCARIGLVTGKGLAANMKRVFPKPIVYMGVAILGFANIFNIGANLVIMAASIKLVVGGNGLWMAAVLAVGIVLMEIFISYHTYSKILIIFSLVLLSYVFTAFIATQDWWYVLENIITPHFSWNRDFILIMTGFIGTTISPYLFFWQTSHEVEDHSDQKKNGMHVRLPQLIRHGRLETFLGMLFSQLMTLFIIITCFSSLHLNNITEINTAADAALALKPLAGEWAFLLFTIGIVGAGLLGIPVLAGSLAYAVSELFDRKAGLAYKYHQARFFYGVIAAATVLGLFIDFIAINPVKALLYAAIINCVASAPLVMLILWLANKAEIMGNNKNGVWSNVFGGVASIVLLLSSLLMFYFL